MGPYFMVYENHTGPYKGTAKIMDRIYDQLLEEDNIETFKGFGIYFDNPKETPEAELRSLAGCIVEPADTAKVSALGNKYKIMEIPERQYVTAEIRYRGQLSIFAGIVKVYPSIEKYMKEKNYPAVPAMEIYDHNKTIIYLFEIKE
jgi:DNA gyrase inhibitor GyrI